MGGLNWSSLGMLRCPVSLRGVFVWLLLALLLTGAASYTHGSRYALVPGHGSLQSAGESGVDAAPPQVHPRRVLLTRQRLRHRASGLSIRPARSLSLKRRRRTAAKDARLPVANRSR